MHTLDFNVKFDSYFAIVTVTVVQIFSAVDFKSLMRKKVAQISIIKHSEIHVNILKSTWKGANFRHRLREDLSSNFFKRKNLTCEHTLSD